MIVAGGTAIAGSSPYAIWLLIGGSIVHLAGWAVLPATGWRRIFAMGPSLVSMWLLLSGPRFLGVLALAYLAWLIVRQRPVVAYVTLVFVFAGSIVLGRVFADYRDMLLAGTIEFAILVASAWAASIVHRATGRRTLSSGRRAERSSSANPQRPEPGTP